VKLVQGLNHVKLGFRKKKNGGIYELGISYMNLG